MSNKDVLERLLAAYLLEAEATPSRDQFLRLVINLIVDKLSSPIGGTYVRAR